MQRPSLAVPAWVPRPSRRSVRVVAIVVLLVGVGVLANSAVAEPGGTATPTRGGEVPYGAHIPIEERINDSEVSTAPIPPDAELTVIATQGFFVEDENAELIAVTRNGTVVYHQSKYKVYFDVDPVEGTRYTVEYVASKHLTDCEQAARCTRNVIERVNISTGEVTRVYSEVTPKIHGTRWHDADRLNETHVYLADIYTDSVRLINTTSNETVWSWSAENLYNKSEGGPEQDWTHINDVEVLPDGRLMLSMRNMDEVVFVDPGNGVQRNWTLGNGDHDIMFEQHNPDYIPASRGGPAVVVADSENDRIIEYHRTDEGTWERKWSWRDARLQWPRDADRLPNGRTLVVDSHGDRVMEVAPNGSVAWSVGVGMPYDVERLGTGDESAGGYAIGAEGKKVDAGFTGKVVLFLKGALPSKLTHGALYVTRIYLPWITFVDLLVAAVLLLDLLVWGLLEYRWAAWSVTGLARTGWDRLFASP